MFAASRVTSAFVSNPQTTRFRASDKSSCAFDVSDAGEPAAADLQRDGGGRARPKHLREQDWARRRHEVPRVHAGVVRCDVPRRRHQGAGVRR